MYALLVYGCTEAYIYFFPSRAAQELNLSMVSCLLVAGSAYKVIIFFDQSITEITLTTLSRSLPL